MIELIHKYPILIKILLTVTTVAFVGTGGYFLGQETARYVARVEDEKITVDQLQRAVYNLEDFYRKIYQGNVPDELFKNIDLNKMALDQLIERKVILVSADRMGLGVGDNEVADAVRKNPSFHDAQGNFSKQAYTEVLRFNNLTPKDFEQSLREDLLIEKFRDLVSDSVMVTDQDARRYFAEQRESQGLAFDEKAYEDNKDKLRPAVEDDLRQKVLRSAIENLKSRLEIETYPDALPAS